MFKKVYIFRRCEFISIEGKEIDVVILWRMRNELSAPAGIFYSHVEVCIALRKASLN